MPVWMNWLDPERSTVPVTIISIALMLAAGFLMTRITKKLRLPNVTAYIVGGILMGPFCLNLIPTTGVTLPFLSYGGTSVIFTMLEIGIALNVAKGIRPETENDTVNPDFDEEFEF